MEPEGNSVVEVPKEVEKKETNLFKGPDNVAIGVNNKFYGKAN